MYSRLQKRSDNPAVEKRKRQERAENRKKESFRKKQKEIKRSHYEKNHAINTLVESKVEIEEVIEEVIELPVKPRSKNWFVRLWRLLDAK